MSGAKNPVLGRDFRSLRVPAGFAAALIVLGFGRPRTPWHLRVGALLALAGEALRIWAAGHIVKLDRLTVAGPYRRIRNPLYAGSSLIAAGVSVMAGPRVFLPLSALYLGALYPRTVREEEAELRAKFGAEFDRYCEKVPALVPVPGRVADATAEEPFSIRRALGNREYNGLLAVLGAILLFRARSGRS